MPAIRAHDMDEFDDDDGMPPLVDNPNPSMNFTFFTDMSPIAYCPAEETRFEVLPDTFIISTPPSSPDLPEGVTAFQENPRASHAKKRDASYIPRPPNAFILFRSSFIKSQQVPGKVEGNHSTLSKIIGMYWKTLPREEREVWEAKALVAQAEHRKRYPDWRFRPGANALAKLKIKDGPGVNKKRNSHGGRKSKDNGEGKGGIREKRCAKIADLLVEGKKGADLEVALKEWDGKDGKGDGAEKQTGSKVEEPVVEMKAEDGAKEVKLSVLSPEEQEMSKRSSTPDAGFDARFKVPLTAMFKRSLSSPAIHDRCDSPVTDLSLRRGSITVLSDICPSPLDAYSSPLLPHASHDGESCVPSLFEDPALIGWNDPFASFDTRMSYTPGNEATDYVHAAPSPDSPLEPGYNLGFSSVPVPGDAFPRACKPDLFANTTIRFDSLERTAYPDYNLEPYPTSPSSYSSLKGWAGDFFPRRSSATEPQPLAVIPSAFNDLQTIARADIVPSDALGWPLAAFNGLDAYDFNPGSGMQADVGLLCGPSPVAPGTNRSNFV